VKKIVGNEGLDILINSIGIGQLGAFRPAEIPISVYREQYEVNLIGPQIVTVAFLPLLRAGKKKIIINLYYISFP
jgi:NAD(P)-dependent dehydrogenase (short-subunit alcohol dehydrogenase family)